MADLPLILAGPILRRVEPALVAVWVALSQPKSLLLSVYEGFQQTGAGTGPFTGVQPRFSGAASTLRVGNNLHIGLVYAVVVPNQALVPGINYSYNLGFGPPIAGAQPGGSLSPLQVNATADLKTEGLLVDKDLPDRPNLALGYTPGELPGFALPPVLLTDLRVLHGSCRRPGQIYDTGEGKKAFDGLAWVDDLIIKWRTGTTAETALDPNTRPHQLFLTGDQIYADDVEEPMLTMLNRVGNALIGKTELLPTRYPPLADPASREKFLGAPKQPGFPDLQSFINKMKSEGKDPLEELKNDRRVRVLEDACFDRTFRLLFEQSFSHAGDFQSDPAAPGVRFWPANLLHFPAGLRRPLFECEAKFSSSDLRSHLVSLGEYCAMYLSVWSNALWERAADGKPVFDKIEDIFKVPAGNLPQIWDLHACFAGEKKCIPRSDTAALNTFLEAMRKRTKEAQRYKNAVDTLEVFFDSLKRVRRALANIPTYMTFDDHDVTDDWNLNRAWRDRAFTAPLGRSVLNASLVAYALFQDWGNDPLRYEVGPFRRLLDRAAEFFPENAPSGPSPALTNQLGKLFGLNQSNPEDPEPELRWHFSIDGPAHRVIALDTRNRRVFRSRYQAPGLLSPQALKEQLPDPAEFPLPAGVEALMVISQTPALQPSLASSIILPLMSSIHELKNHENMANLTGVEPDNEIWPGDDQAFDLLVRRLAKYKQVVVLSGEVHFGYTAQMSVWEKGIKRTTLPASTRGDLDQERLSPVLRGAFQSAGITLDAGAFVTLREGNAEWLVTDEENRKVYLVRDEETGLNVYEEQGPARIAQFVSSGLKNAKGTIATLARLMGFAFSLIDLTPVERLIWQEHFPKPLFLPEGARPPLPVRGRLSGDPVNLPAGNWPPGTLVKKQPDFAWRIDMVRDERPDSERPDFARPSGAAPEFDPGDIPASYHAISVRHSEQISRMRFARGVIYQSNLGLVRFERDDHNNLVACHDLYTHKPGKHEPVLVNIYRVPLTLFSDPRPQLKFDQAAEES